MKKTIVFGVVGVLALAMGTTTLASGRFSKKDNGDYYCMNYCDADSDGICDNCHDANMHGDSHHNTYFDNGASGNGSLGRHHSEGHGMGRHHR